MGWKDIEEKTLEELGAVKRAWVQERVSLEAQNDLQGKSREELTEMFPYTTEDLNDEACMKTFVWQAWLRIKAGELEPVDGNERSFWYRDVEPFYIEKGLMDPGRGKDLRCGELFTVMKRVEEEGLLEKPGWFLPSVSRELLEELGRKDPEAFTRLFHGAKETYVTNLVSRTLNDFVKAGIFRFHYKVPTPGDFKFRDPREEFRIIGRKRPRLMFFTEKEGLWWLCEYAAEKYGITVVASKGEPGLLATEYLYDALVAAGAMSLEIGAITDYDPWGAKIPENFEEKLREGIFYGPSPERVHLVHLDKWEKDLDRFFTEQELERYKRDLRLYSAYKQGTVDDWVNSGCGIKGEKYGIHIDTANRQRLRAEVDRWVKEVL
ncbi:MAG: hypothetical protein RDV48_31240 [Candidatus Eremiobacteraeota bacterium]|nr:hypothetical protein [Candidatus Eremiobacteraeota bacterium]